MEISPEMVRDAIRNIIQSELSFYLEDLMGQSEALDRTAIILTRHCYSFAEFPEPKLTMPKMPRP